MRTRLSKWTSHTGKSWDDASANVRCIVFSLEVFGARKILKSTAFSSESINHAGFQFGFIFNMDAIGKY